jgi:hypothetical protein
VISLYAADEYRSSDHDPVIVDLELGGERVYLPIVMRGYPQPWDSDRCLTVAKGFRLSHPVRCISRHSADPVTTG